MIKLILQITLIICIIFNSKSIFCQYAAPDPMSVGNGPQNTVVGVNAGNSSSAGNNNSVFGTSAGQSLNDGSNNTLFGRVSGNSVYSGSFNTMIGAQSGNSVVNGHGNTFIGNSSGAFIAGSRNICIGNSTGPDIDENRSISDRLFIDVKNGLSPLIYGEFDNNFVRINGTFEVTAGLSNPSDVNLKNNFSEVDEFSILEKIANLEIKQWTYKTRQGEKHIGPTAQDFYNTFKVGINDKSISTIDADGISLVAIKALKKENDNLKEILKEHEILINKILMELEECSK